MAQERDRYKKPAQPLSEGRKKAAQAFMNPMRKLARKLIKTQSAETKGERLAEKVIGPEGLERLADSADVQEIKARRKQMADEGIGQAEQEALRAKMAKQMMQAEQAAGLRLGGALGGAQGASVAAQQRSLMAQGMQARAGIERDIFLAQEEAKRIGLDKYASHVGEVEMFDIGQAAKERDILQSSIMGYEQIASADRAAKLQADAAIKARPRCHVEGTKVLMADGLFKNIEDIRLGDVVEFGGKVVGVGQVLTKEDIYELNEEQFTASHLIFDKNTKSYRPAKEISVTSLVSTDKETVVYPICTENRCYYTSFLSGDLTMEEEYNEGRSWVLEQYGAKESY